MRVLARVHLRPHFVLALFALVSLATGVAAAQGGAIMGTVTTQGTGEPVAEARVLQSEGHLGGKFGGEAEERVHRCVVIREAAGSDPARTG